MQEGPEPFSRVPPIGCGQADRFVNLGVQFAFPDDIEYLSQLVIIQAFKRHAVNGRLGAVGLMGQDILRQPEAITSADQLALFGDDQG